MKEIKFDDWQKLDLRVGEIKKVEEIENADKLYKLEIDLGNELGKRTLIAGIKEHYLQEKLIGKKVIVFCNLEPKTIRGIESNGMILAAVTNNHKKVQILQPDKDIELGSKVM